MYNISPLLCKVSYPDIIYTRVYWIQFISFLNNIPNSKCNSCEEDNFLIILSIKKMSCCNPTYPKFWPNPRLFKKCSWKLLSIKYGKEEKLLLKCSTSNTNTKNSNLSCKIAIVIIPIVKSVICDFFDSMSMNRFIYFQQKMGGWFIFEGHFTLFRVFIMGGKINPAFIPSYFSKGRLWRYIFLFMLEQTVACFTPCHHK